ncbi:MAG: sensor histidine kinase [Paracoccaceae bacterium]
MMRAILCWLLCLVGIEACALPLPDQVRVMIGDDPGFADPKLDDSDWAVQRLLLAGGWPARGADNSENAYWMRIDVDGAAVSRLADPALVLGVMTGAHSVYLNGQQIGQTAVIDPPFLGLKTNQTRALPRVYPLPKELLVKDGRDVIALRVVRIGFELAGPVAGPFEIVEYGRALASVQSLTLKFVVISILPSILMVIALLVIGFVLVSANPSRGLGWLFVTFLCIAPLGLATNSLMTQLDALPGPVASLVMFQLAGLSLAPSLVYVIRTLDPQGAWIGWSLSAGFVLLMALSIPGYPFPEDVLNSLVMVWTIMVMLSFLLIAVWAVMAVIQGQGGAWPMVIGATLLWAATAMIALDGEQWFMAHLGTDPLDLAIPVFLICLAWMGWQHHLDGQRRLREAQGQILTAQAAERQRLARDIHDGVGQWLSVIKLNLQMLRSRYQNTPDAQGFDDVVTHVESAMQDARRIAHDLSPAMLAEKGLGEAMQAHGEAISLRSGVSVTVSTEQGLNLSELAQGHLYRIFQETVQNALKHGDASRIAAELKRHADGFQLSIQDNGVGYDASSETAENGMGLTSIRQRVELLGARLETSSTPGQGTNVVILGPELRS